MYEKLKPIECSRLLFPSSESADELLNTERMLTATSKIDALIPGINESWIQITDVDNEVPYINHQEIHETYVLRGV